MEVAITRWSSTWTLEGKEGKGKEEREMEGKTLKSKNGPRVCNSIDVVLIRSLLLVSPYHFPSFPLSSLMQS